MTYITRISIKGFESHEDTVLDDLSPGLNAIVGLSMSGKSAIVRALAAISYNQFDPKSLRTGCDNCEIEVTTTNGKVKVTRGKKNLWEVTDRSGKTAYFDRIGKQILLQVTEILGFGLVKLGDIEMKVNIMDQLEAHFMLAEFDGQDATGSLRAQVVDEISGLSGIEGLIREVSLDNLRLTRETNQTEERIKEVAAQLHDGQTLNHEEALLKRVGEAIQKYDENLEVLMALKGIDTDYRNAKGEVSRLKDELNNLPNATKALTKLATGETALAKTTATSTAYAEWSIINKLCATMKIEADSLPDDLKVTEKAQQALEALQKAIQVATLAKNTLVESEITMKLHNELAKTSDPEAVKSRLLVAEKSLDKALQISEFLFQWGSLDGEIKRLDNERVAVRVGEELAAQEYNEALAKVDVCPVTLKPISGECLKEGRLVISIKENR